MWSSLLNFLASLVRVPLTHLIAFFVGKRSGRKEYEADQLKHDLDAIANADDARRRVTPGDDRMHIDPFNRDNS